MPTITLPRFSDMLKKQPTEKDLNDQRVRDQYKKEAITQADLEAQKQIVKSNIPSLIFVLLVVAATIYGYFSQEFVARFFTELIISWIDQANLFIRTPQGILILAMFIYIVAVTKFPAQTHFIQTKTSTLWSKLSSLLQR